MATLEQKFYAPGFRHLRSDPTMYALHFRKGELVREGQGQAFWFRPLHSAVAEVPLDDRDLSFMFEGRTKDFQNITVQGAITYRVADAKVLANRINFSVNLSNGNWKESPLQQLQGLLSQLAQQFVWDYLTSTDLKVVMTDGVDQIRAKISGGLTAETALAELGLVIVAVRVADIKPDHVVEQALQTPALEAIQRESDEAGFSRRANASEKERAIAEQNEENRLILAQKQEEFIKQEDANERRRVEGQAERQRLTAASTATQSRIAADEQAEQERIRARAQADREKIETAATAETTRELARAEEERINAVEGAKVEQERNRMELYKDMDPRTLMALGFQNLGGTLRNIEHLTITPDMLTQIASRFGDGGNEQ